MTNDSEVELNCIECHFNWNIVKVDSNEKGDSIKDDYFFEDRIGTLEGHISDNDVRNLPQIYTTKAYYMAMYIKLLNKLPSINRKKIKELKDKAKESFHTALEKSGDNSGYKAVIYGNLVHFYTHFKKDEDKAKDNLRLHKKSLLNLTNKQKQEIIAMKAYVLSYSFEYQEAARKYEEAINNCKEDPPPEWVFGLAHVKHKQKYNQSSVQGNVIEDLYRYVVKLDPEYYFAKLRLARILWERHGIQNIDEIEYLIKEVTGNNKENNILLEEAASILRLTCKDKEENFKKVLELYQQCERINIESPKTLRGFALYYLDRKEYNKSIEYYKRLIEVSEKYFEKTGLAEVYRCAHSCPKRNDALKELYEDLDLQCKNESFRGKLDIWYSFSKHHRYTEENTEKEIEYLTKVIDHAHKAKEDIYGKIWIIKDSQNRLLELAEVRALENKDDISPLELKSKVFASQKCYDSAIYYLDKAKNKAKDEGILLKLQETQVQYHFDSFLIKQNIDYLKNSELETKLLMKKIEELQDSSNIKWEILTDKIRLDDHKELDTLRDAWKTFENKEKSRNPEHEIDIKLAHDLIDESKRTLEASMSYIEKNIFPNSNEKKKCAYPSPLKFTKSNDFYVTMEKIFEKDYDWQDFSIKLPNLIEFFVERQDLQKYDWLENFFAIRNKGQHDSLKEMEKLLKEKYSKPQDQVNMIRKAAWYASEVSIDVYKEVQTYVSTEV